MRAVPLNQAFAIALQHHQAGRLIEAETLYRQLIAAQPNHAGALHFLGVIAHQSGRGDLALELIRKAIALDTDNAAAHSNLGETYRALGRFDEATACLRRALELNPESPVAHNNLGIALAGQGEFGAAIASYRRAIQLRPDFAEACNNLGLALVERRRLEEAIGCYARAIQLRPAFPEAHNNLGIALAEQGRVGEAIAAYHRALAIKPDYAKACYNLGIALTGQRQIDEGIACYRRAIELKPDYPDAFNNLGIALAGQGRFDEAILAYRSALEFRPDDPEAHNNLGNALRDQGHLDAAAAAYQLALHGKPEHAEIHNNLGNVLRDQGRLDEAAAAYRRALELKADHPGAHNNLGNVLKDQGRLDEAMNVYRQAVRFKPGDLGLHSNLVYTLHFLPGLDETTIIEEQRHWNQTVGEPLKRFVRLHANDRDPERPLRIGYVSPDFRDHVIGRNLLPLFKRHDSRLFEIICYSGVLKPDCFTEEFRRHSDQWRNAVGVADERLIEMIREDGVDILVDLSQHLAGNRLPMFAQQPAPVQVSFAGYPAGTGLDAIRYRISDRWLEGAMANGKWKMANEMRKIGWKCEGGLEMPKDEPRPAEQVFLIDSFWCYDPCGMEVAVNELPAKEGGPMTFGSLNNFCKVNEPLLKLWARLLGKTKDSRLVLLSGSGSHRERTAGYLERKGIEPSRVEFVEPRARRSYLELYHRLDVALDTFPYNGHTTSLDALWMGVPVVSLAGERSVSRAGLSQLSNLGLAELVASSEDEYVRMAVGLTEDLSRLAELRATLRRRMEASALMDAPRFAQQIEAAYRAMWRHWCGGR